MGRKRDSALKPWYIAHGFNMYMVFSGWGVGYDPKTKALMASSDVDGIDFSLEDLEDSIAVLNHIRDQVTSESN